MLLTPSISMPCINLSTLPIGNKMKIEHLAIWVGDIEKMSLFYTSYFDCTRNARYNNPQKKYTSYFLSFRDGSSRIELMHRPDILNEPSQRGFERGVAHFAIQLESAEAVDSLTERLREDGYTIASEPRRTGDGYYESGILDPEGNYVEITV